MIVTMARLLKDAESAFMGVASNLPFFSIWLARELYNPDFVWFSIPGRLNPSPSTPPRSTLGRQLSEGGRSIMTLAEIFDLAVRNELDIAFLSGVQIDRHGNFNLSHIPEGDTIRTVFTGGAGSALICANTKRVIFWRTRHDKKSLVYECPVITASGNIYRVVTSAAVFRKESGELVLDSVLPGSSFEEVRENTGFPVEAAPSSEPPTEEELGLLRDFDPEGIREIEF